MGFAEDHESLIIKSHTSNAIKVAYGSFSCQNGSFSFLIIFMIIKNKAIRYKIMIVYVSLLS